mmetsp:Transcript_18873/g.41051  ORF Transcript_18873/g.41051 Transcript_18873/m.41051 type:complete len:366 (-) Transcript_18873:248-1345(-)
MSITLKTTRSREATRMSALTTILKKWQGQLGWWMLISLTFQLLWNLRYNYNPVSNDASGHETKVRGNDTGDNESYVVSLAYDSENIPAVNLAKANANTKIIYGHLHMHKTGGSNINGMMAIKYDNVCGNKGSSYNAFTVNTKRLKKDSTNGKRGVKFDKFRSEIGFENCDYISIETKWMDWKTHIIDALDFAKHNMQLELHVPCRGVVDQFLSLCNHRQVSFQCPDFNNEEAIEDEIKKCLWQPPGKGTAPPKKPASILLNRARYDPKLKNHSEYMQLKCFSPFPIEDYISYMGQYLRPRKIEAPFANRKTNKDRSKSTECLLTQDDNYRGVVKRLILELDFMGYHKFCEECMGSSDQLKIPSPL